jgi:hypothetical protein
LSTITGILPIKGVPVLVSAVAIWPCWSTKKLVGSGICLLLLCFCPKLALWMLRTRYSQVR